MAKEELHYHYDRSERRRSLPDSLKERLENPPPRGLFKRNRALTILLLDVLVIIFMYFIVLPFINASFSSAVIEGYRFTLQGFHFEDTGYVSVSVEAIDTPKGNEDNLVSVIFTIEGTDNKTTVFDILPEGKGGSRIIRATLRMRKEDGKVFAVVSAGGQEKKLSATIKPEGE